MEKEQGRPGGLKSSSSNGKGREFVTQQQVVGSKRQQHFQKETEGRDYVEKWAEYPADEQGLDYQEDATSRTTAAPSIPSVESISEERHSESY